MPRNSINPEGRVRVRWDYVSFSDGSTSLVCLSSNRRAGKTHGARAGAPAASISRFSRFSTSHQ